MTTGAPVPDDCIAVVPIENIEKLEDGKISINCEVSEGQYIRQPGSDIKTGQLVLEAREVLNAAEIGLLATVGRI